jgi:RNA polymerase sigma factor (sigma-70 family)
MGLPDSDADDVANDVALEFHHKWEQLNLEKLSCQPRWEAYIRRATLNRVRQDARSNGRRIKREEAHEAPRLVHPTQRPGTLRPGPATIDPDHDDYETLIQRLVLIEAAAKLPPTQRTVVLHTLIDGMSINEIADLRGRTPGAVRATLARAIKTLRTNLGV